MKFLKTSTHDFMSVKELLHHHVGELEQGRSPKNLHASSLTKEDPEYCPRAHAYEYGSNKATEHLVNTTLRVTFDMGNAIQSLLNNVWLRDQNYGNWVCSSCGTSKMFTTAPQKACGKAGVRCNWNYSEIMFRHKELNRLIGSIDCLINNGGPKLRMVECKIMDKDYFKALKAPLSEHKVRTKLYLKLIAESDSELKNLIDLEEATILYISRSFGFKDEKGRISPFKEYHVKRNDEDVQYLMDKASKFQDFVDTGVHPPRICDTISCPRANLCKVRALCFSEGVTA